MATIANQGFCPLQYSQDYTHRLPRSLDRLICLSIYHPSPDSGFSHDRKCLPKLPKVKSPLIVSNGVVVRLVTDGVIKKHAHYVADLRFCRRGQWSSVCTQQFTTPIFNGDCTYVTDVQTPPCGPHPSREEISVDRLRGVGLSAVKLISGYRNSAGMINKVGNCYSLLPLAI